MTFRVHEESASPETRLRPLGYPARLSAVLPRAERVSHISRISNALIWLSAVVLFRRYNIVSSCIIYPRPRTDEKKRKNAKYYCASSLGGGGGAGTKIRLSPEAGVTNRYVAGGFPAARVREEVPAGVNRNGGIARRLIFTRRRESGSPITQSRRLMKSRERNDKNDELVNSLLP